MIYPGSLTHSHFTIIKSTVMRLLNVKKLKCEMPGSKNISLLLFIAGRKSTVSGIAQ